MKKEVKNWLKHAESDYRDAKLLWENHRYGATVLFYQQATEKILKAYILEQTKTVPKRTHRIEILFKDANLDINELKPLNEKDLEELSKSYIRVRYPDLNRQYYRLRSRAEPLARSAEKVYLWVLNKFKEI